jgi:Uma2 family endonuclease
MIIVLSFAFRITVFNESIAMSAQPKRFISPQEYLDRERCAEVKSEYYQGEIFPMEFSSEGGGNGIVAMAGARRAHSAINANVISALVVGLRGRGCTVYTNDLRLHIPANSLYTYPDATVVCGKAEMLDGEFDTLLNPLLLVEVLSASTEDEDRNAKFRLYRSIPSLCEYVMVSQYEHHIASYYRNHSGDWIYTDAEGFHASLHLPSVQTDLVFADVYAGIEMEVKPKR